METHGRTPAPPFFGAGDSWLADDSRAGQYIYYN